MLNDGVKRAPSGRVAQLDRVSASVADTHPAAARFWTKVDKTDGCWIWTAGVTSAGYGSFGLETHPRVRMVSAHRLSWEWANGRPVPAGMVLMHACDNRRCVRPDHLSIGTVADNNRDMKEKGRSVKGRAWHGQQACSKCRQKGHNRVSCGREAKS